MPTANRKVTQIRSAAVSPLVRRPGPAERDPRKYSAKRRRLEHGLAWIAPILFVLLWQFTSSSHAIDPRFFPAPLSLWGTFVDLLKSGELQTDIWASFQRVLIGFAFGSVSGIIVGVILGMSRTLRAALNPFLSAMYVVPTLAILPLLLLIFGTGNLPLILLIAIAIFFFMWLSTMQAIINVDESYLEAGRSFGANRLQMFRHVLFPAALPQIFVGLRLSAGMSVLIVVGIELVEGTHGLGVLIWNSWSLFQAKPMYVGIVTVSVLGAAFVLLMGLISRVATPWSKSSRTVRGMY